MRPDTIRHPARIACAIAALTLLAGCSGGRGLAWPFGSRDSAVATPAPGTPVPSNDPVVVFAARAQPGTQDRVTLADGQPATLRLVRVYHSANGRECREVMVNAGMAERQRVVCAANGGWTEARPLLRGGAGRP